MSSQPYPTDLSARPKDHALSERLSRLDAQGLLRSLRTLPSSGGHIEIDGARVLNFSSNDYLNLANDPRLKQRAIEAVERCGCGATASRLMAGHLAIHEELESRIAAYMNAESALVFPTGFQTNVGVLSALGAADTHLFSDELNHASIVDGCRLAEAPVSIYNHCDMNHLEDLLRTTGAESQRIIVTDSIFSMDGDEAPLVALGELAERYDAMLVVDEAHALGVFGAGLCAKAGVRADVIVGTLSKALGGEGGFAACSHTTRELILNRARTFIFSTGLAPACAGSALGALDVLKAEPELGEESVKRSLFFREQLNAKGLDVPMDRSPIVPLLVGGNEESVALSQSLLAQGILAAAVRPPTVPRGTSRIRFSLTLGHTEEDLAAVAAIAAEAYASRTA